MRKYVYMKQYGYCRMSSAKIKMNIKLLNRHNTATWFYSLLLAKCCYWPTICPVLYKRDKYFHYNQVKKIKKFRTRLPAVY